MELDRLRKDFGRRRAQILPISEAISEQAVALVEARFLSDGLLLADAPIAATAIEYNSALCSANSKHFRGIPGLLLQTFERLRLATAKPVEVEWRLPERIEFRRTEQAPVYERHLFLEEDGSFRVDLGIWERELLAEELTNPSVVGWLRNLDRKPWSLEIPYQTGGAVRPMFPDLLIVRREGTGDGADYRFDILEPHDPSRDDNFEKAVGLARFAERHGHLFHRIQLIRKQASAAGGECFYRLELNSESVRKQVLPITADALLDAIFAQCVW